MPEEAPTTEAPETGTPPESPEAPINGAPPEAPSDSPDTDWKQRAEEFEKRYNDLRPEADRRASILADIEGRNGPERQAAALAERAQIELEDEEAEEPEEDFDLPPDPNERIDALERQRAEEQAQREQDEFDRLEQDYLESTVATLEGDANVKLNEEQYGFVINDALNNRDPHDGKPDVEGSFKKLKAMLDSAGVEWGKTKDTVVPPGGAPGEKQITPEMLRNKETRQKIALEAFQAAKEA